MFPECIMYNANQLFLKGYQCSSIRDLSAYKSVSDRPVRKTPGLPTVRQTSVSNWLTATFGKWIPTLKFAISACECWPFLGCSDRRKLLKAFTGVLLQLPWDFCSEGVRAKLIKPTWETCSRMFQFTSTWRIHIWLRSVYRLSKHKAKLN